MAKEKGTGECWPQKGSFHKNQLARSSEWSYGREEKSRESCRDEPAINCVECVDHEVVGHTSRFFA